MSAATFLPEPSLAREVYRRPAPHGGDTTRVLRYYRRTVVRGGRWGTEHRVAVDRPGSEGGRTELYRFGDVGEARRCWTEQRRALSCCGYSRETN